ncbi:MAG TPA: exodeoxyribonuclease V subunit alpha [Burkholderiales bacterium]|nr:exodeoxyribonuclease V subunit alpha [Burkholderiales bacterium]
MAERAIASSSTRGEIELTDIDLQFARTVSRLGGSERAELLLAAALASRATGNGDVCANLADFAGMSVPQLDTTVPPVERWIQMLREEPVVAEPGEFRPLVLDQAGRLYLYRYWDYERRLAEALTARAVAADGVDEKLLRSGLNRYFPDAADIEQKLAAALAVLRRFCVISGGPGTGKTTTVVKILALLAEQAHGRLSIRLTAPTGKAAARVQAAVSAALGGLELDLFTRECMPTEAFTIHRLLGARPNAASYRFGRSNPLPLDVLVVDEASMADLALAVKLVEALPPQARLILLGDKDQLASVEAGAVLGEICRSAGYTAPFGKRLAGVAGVQASRVSKTDVNACALSDSIAFLERSYRFGPESGIGALSRHVNAGDGDAALALLKADAPADVTWRSVGASELRAQLGGYVVERLRPYFEAVRGGAPPQDILQRFDAFRVLCAHRSGLFGIAAVNRAIEEALDAAHLVSARHGWYAGRPVIVTQNDYSLRLFNGDVGIALPDPLEPARLTVFFASGSEGVRSVAPARLPEHETVYAMTIHKSQGSEFGEVLIVLPPELSPVLSRELVYTGITRAMRGVEVWGTEAVFAAAIERRLTRASALQEKLWGARSRAKIAAAP